MAQNLVLYAEIDATTLGNFVKFPTRGITRACVQATKLTASVNDTTTFGVRYSNNGGQFLEYATPKTITPSAPTGAYNVSPIQVGATEPFDINAQWIDVYVKANAAANKWKIELLSVDQVTPGGSVVEETTMREVLVIGNNVFSPGGGGGGSGGGSDGSSNSGIPSSF